MVEGPSWGCGCGCAWSCDVRPWSVERGGKVTTSPSSMLPQATPDMPCFPVVKFRLLARALALALPPPLLLLEPSPLPPLYSQCRAVSRTWAKRSSAFTYSHLSCLVLPKSGAVASTGAAEVVVVVVAVVVVTLRGTGLLLPRLGVLVCCFFDCMFMMWLESCGVCLARGSTIEL